VRVLRTSWLLGNGRMVLLACAIVFSTGCSDRIQLPPKDVFERFQHVAPHRPAEKMGTATVTLPQPGPYRIRPGDVLEITLASFLSTVSIEQAIPQTQTTSIACRVQPPGHIVLPVVGQVHVAGLTIPEVESAISNAYYPTYTKTYPAVLVRLAEARKERVSILGVVARPGVYELRADQMSLVQLLAEAGGIVQPGASCIRILRPGQEGQTTITVPMRGPTVPFSDVPLREADQVIAERLVVPLFTVIGLVNRPGNFEYPPDANYTLIQAIAFAGGLDLRLDPRYAVIYRLDHDGSIIHAVFQLSDPKRPQATTTSINVPIRPGDIIAIEHTPRTRSREFLDRIFNVHIGAYLPLIR